MIPLGDSTLLVELGSSIDRDTHERVRAAFDALTAAAIPGVHDVVPAYTGLAVHYDPLRVRQTPRDPADAAWSRLRRTVAEVLDAHVGAPGEVDEQRVVEIPVYYGGEHGPDLEHVARHSRLSTHEVVSLHASPEYRVYMIGFTPGFPYLGGLPAQLATPRRASPRARVPAGSVGIAGGQTGIYPLSTPGGWQLIGRTELQLFRPDLQPPTLLRLGDRVQFVPVGRT